MKQLALAITLLFTMMIASGAAALARVPKEIHTVHEFIQAKAGKSKADRYAGMITSISRKNGVPPMLTAKVINRESTFNPRAVNARCVGLMQVDRIYWFKPGQNPYDPATNINAGTKLLARLYGRFHSWPQALTGYNYGENHRVTRSVGTSEYAFLVLKGL